MCLCVTIQATARMAFTVYDTFLGLSEEVFSLFLCIVYVRACVYLRVLHGRNDSKA